MAKYFNKNLKHIRALRGISQQVLADQIGVDRTAIGKWETEVCDVLVDNAVNCAIALKVPIPEFLGTDMTGYTQDDLESLNPIDSEWFAKTKDLSDEKRRQVLDIIDVINK